MMHAKRNKTPGQSIYRCATWKKRAHPVEEECWVKYTEIRDKTRDSNIVNKPEEEQAE